jgi:hypothetical protein
MAYLTSSMVLTTSASEPRSSFKMAGGLAREKPVPTTFQSCLLKAVTTCRPRRPVAPVIRAVLAMAMYVGMVLLRASTWAGGGRVCMTAP